MATLPYLLWLTGREGLRPETAAALLRRFGTAGVSRPWAQLRADDAPIELPLYAGRISPETWAPRGAEAGE